MYWRKKCIPMNFSGRIDFSARPVIGRVEVFEAKLRLNPYFFGLFVIFPFLNRDLQILPLLLSHNFLVVIVSSSVMRLVFHPFFPFVYGPV
ncbi:MAG: hypothetical protein CM1200mP10_32550 [Candidatus Neomarinimicrobiota bacterium]|nr:MAG: hypothetical protein CM1200mP10_32550 [Candidatus Neomarinimicrobiota bacterium]